MVRFSKFNTIVLDFIGYMEKYLKLAKFNILLLIECISKNSISKYRGKHILEKVFNNRPSKICGRQPLEILLGPFLNTFSYITCNVSLPNNSIVSTRDNRRIVGNVQNVLSTHTRKNSRVIYPLRLYFS